MLSFKRFVLITQLLLCCFSVQGQLNSERKYFFKLVKNYCEVCSVKAPRALISNFYLVQKEQLVKLFHQAHTIHKSSEDNLRYESIINAIELAKEYKRDTLLFFCTI
jgi:hypothetical protein